MPHPTDEEAIRAIFAGCDLLGPGGPDETRRLGEAIGLQRGQRVLELGSGTGRAALQLVNDFGVEVVMLESSPGLARGSRARVHGANRGNPIQVREADMHEAAELFPPRSFDAILAEGSLYIMGIRNAARAAQSLLPAGGRIGFTELTWTASPERAARRVREFWDREAPTVISSVEEKLARMSAAGLKKGRAAFTLPAEAWDRYYAPIRKNLDALRDKGVESAIVEAFEEELRIHYEMGGREVAGYVAYVGEV